MIITVTAHTHFPYHMMQHEELEISAMLYKREESSLPYRVPPGSGKDHSEEGRERSISSTEVGSLQSEWLDPKAQITHSRCTMVMRDEEGRRVVEKMSYGVCHIQETGSSNSRLPP